MSEQFANHPGTTLSAAITTTARPINFAVASAVGLPSTGNFRVLIDSEIFLITYISGTTLYGSNVEGTTASTHAVGAPVNHILTAGALVQAESDAAALANATCLKIANNLSDVSNVNIARSNLCTGSASTVVGSGTVMGSLNDSFIAIDATAGITYYYLASGLTNSQNQIVTVKKVDSTANPVTINGNGNTIDGQSSISLTNQYASVTMQWNGAGWSILNWVPGLWQNWTPTLAGYQQMTASAPTNCVARYLRTSLSEVRFHFALNTTLGGTPSYLLNISLPFTESSGSSTSASCNLNGGAISAYVVSGTNTFQIYSAVFGCYGGSFPTGSIGLMCSGSYQIVGS